MSVRVLRAAQRPLPTSSAASLPEPAAARFLGLATARKIDGASDARKSEAERTLADAQRTAEALLQDAKRTADQVVEAARSEAAAAFEEARRAGIEAASVEVAAKLMTLQAALQAAEAQLVDRLTPSLLAVVRAVAERAAVAQLAMDDVALAAWVRSGLERLRAARRIRVQAGPAVAARLEAILSGSAYQVLEVRVDPRLGDGSVRLESDFGACVLDVPMHVDSLVSAVEDWVRGELVRIAAQPSTRPEPSA